MPVLKLHRSCRYRDSHGRVYHAIITNVVNPTTIDLRVGNGPTKMVVTNVAKVSPHSIEEGWFLSGG